MHTTLLKIIALGGLGEVGLNLMVVECGNDIMIVDCGVLFPDLYWMGLDLVLPDFSYLVENEKKIKGLVVTHGHEDHIGAIPFLLKKIKVPTIYCSRFASRLLDEKCAEHGVGSAFHSRSVDAGDVVEMGSFSVEFIHVTHSTLQTFALGIDTPAGYVVHSGDFKFDEKPYAGRASDKKRLAQLSKKNPVLLLSDSTNSERCGHSQSETSISDELLRLVEDSPQAVVVALFASNIHRVHQLIDIAEKVGRKIFLSGRSMERYVQIAIEENFLPVKLSLLRPLEEIGSYDRREVLVLSTGSQGEARSSLLRLAKNENRWFKLKPEDVVILSSRNIPGNEKAINYVVNELCRLGAVVHYEDMKNVHVSGHAYQSEQLELIDLVKPRYFIPIHGEYRHLKLHAKTAQDSGAIENAFVIENGTVWSFDPKADKVDTSETVITGRHWVFQDVTGAMDDECIKTRRSAARGGIVVITCVLEKKGRVLEKSPSVTTSGLLCDKKRKAKIEEEIEKSCEHAFENWNARNPEGYTHEQFVGAAAKRVIRRHFDAKPLVIVTFINAK